MHKKGEARNGNKLFQGLYIIYEVIQYYLKIKCDEDICCKFQRKYTHAQQAKQK